MPPERRTTIKCVVWDLDDTLWEGVLAEGGGTVLRPGVLDTLEALDQRGILHSVASKNEPGRALERLRELGVADYLLCPQISWEPKSSLVAAIAKHLNIGLDSLLFIDDSPFERAEVADVHPQVWCLDSAEAATLADLPAFDRVPTPDGAVRRRRYQQAEVRRDYEESFQGPRAEFLKTLDLRLTVAPATPDDLLRSAELTERTHQLNTTGLVFDAAQLAALIPRADQRLLVIGLEDRFGGYGTVGIVLLGTDAREWRIRLFLMSCRVMGRNVGGAVLALLAREADAAGVDLTADFLANDVNRPMYMVYRLAGFTETGREGEVQRLRLRPGVGRANPDYVALNSLIRPAAPATQETNMQAFTDRWEQGFAPLYDSRELAEISWVTTSVSPALQQLVIDGVIPRGSQVVDLACGPGVHATFLARHGMTVTGVDRSTTALAKARQLADFYDCDITFLEGDILNTPLATGSADVVHDSFVYHNVRPEARAAYFQEAARLLRPGGLFVMVGFSDRMTPGSGPIRLTSDEVVLPALEHFSVEELRRFRNLPTEKRPDQWHWLGLFRRR
ncbi:HAD-IIIC family phosphatase [Streptacidiphilus sp. P02-A3a]|uniref:HAD-IIIC family phosphatase n=1 Tax=Streptacidiphilus sp. P02-A3a TaxID=2704468 RepID=UPI0015FCD738|nr:HAD-IIIC family phosphatase [Streptacidiphilus sp. P02-A3a]QMU67392.1 HAD-IIIC family phosphatase [Streptacidiphilus sp. P02-A3a]